MIGSRLTDATAVHSMTTADIAISALAATVIFWSSHAMAAEAPATPTTAIGIAVFPFELEDFGAAAKAGQDVPLAQATEEATQQLLQSGRYRPIDATHAELGPAKQQGLRNCGGCEAAIAKQLGADQALVGVITRISMTEYVVRFQVSDAQAGNVVARFSTDLRMGADYSWSRGVRWLMQNRMLATN